jgi:hypothetical protein
MKRARHTPVPSRNQSRMSATSGTPPPLCNRFPSMRRRTAGAVIASERRTKEL